MHTITAIHAREILDSRGNPTVEVDITLNSGHTGRAAVPSGASTGSHEATELRDADPHRFHSKGVTRAVAGVHTEIAQAIVGKPFDQQTIDDALIQLDGTPNKSRLGANAILGVSLAFAHTCAIADNIPFYQYIHAHNPNTPITLPTPMMNVINGGAHATGSSDFQEYMIVPHGFDTFADKLRAGSEIFHTLKKILADNHLTTTVGDEGGFAPVCATNETPLQFIMQAIEQSGYTPGTQIGIALDVAASEFYTDGIYTLATENKKLPTPEFSNHLVELTKKYPIISIEDPFAEDDWDGFIHLTQEIGNTIQIVGDDLFVTNPARLQTGIDRGAANAILIKPNQIGTLSETLDTIHLAQSVNWNVIISHRSGETEDTTIADLAVGVGARYIKTGSLSRSERVAKYNQLLRIAEQL